MSSEHRERERIDAFLASRRIALVGASSRADDFSRAVMRELIAHGIDVVPVHPQAERIEDRPAYRSVRDVPGKLDGALVMTPARVAAEVVEVCAARGIPRVWLHRGVGEGAVSEAALAACQAHGIEVVAGRCPLMFLDARPAFIHRLHAACLRLVGRYPAARPS